MRDVLREDMTIQRRKIDHVERDTEGMPLIGVEGKSSGDGAEGIDGDTLTDPHAGCRLTK